MNKIYLLLLTLLLAQPAFGQDFGCGVSTIPENKVQYGCGCGYYKQGNSAAPTLFQSDFSFESPKMFIKGKLVKLQSQKVEDLPDNPKRGDKFSQTYTYEGIKIN